MTACEVKQKGGQVANNNDASRWKLISFLLTGILIPLAAAGIPWALDNLFAGGLNYRFNGPVSSNGAVAYEVTVSNDGPRVQDQVEIWLPIRIISDYDVKIDEKTGRTITVEKKPDVRISANIDPTKIEEQGNHRVVSYALLRPDESITISLLAVGGAYPLLRYDLERLRVVSRESIGTLDMPDEDTVILYQGFSILGVVLIILILCMAIYIEYIMPIEKRREQLRKELQKLDARGA